MSIPARCNYTFKRGACAKCLNPLYLLLSLFQFIKFIRCMLFVVNIFRFMFSLVSAFYATFFSLVIYSVGSFYLSLYRSLMSYSPLSILSLSSLFPFPSQYFFNQKRSFPSISSSPTVVAAVNADPIGFLDEESDALDDPLANELYRIVVNV